MNIIQLKSSYEREHKQKGYERTYYFSDEDGVPRWSCDVYGECIKAPTVYRPSDDDNQEFKMVAKGKVFNATYFLENSQGTKFATITRKGIGFRWKILGENNQEIGRVIDPSSINEAFFRELFTAQPDSYAVVTEESIIGIIQKEKLLNQNQPEQTKPKNVIGKFLGKILARGGLTLRLETEKRSSLDTRILLASITLLHVHDILGANRQ